MAHFVVDDLRLAYDDLAPDGEVRGVVVLAHGFASNRAENWRRLGWYAAFAQAGYRVAAFDLRGHGESDKPHAPERYARVELARDIIRLMDAAGIRRAHLMGYSLGAHLALAAALAAPERIDKLVLGGIGGRLLGPPPPAPAMSLAEALLTDDPEAIADPVQRGFRQFAEAQGDDRAALAACSRGVAAGATIPDLARLAPSTLVAAGAQDDLAGDPAILAAALPEARAVVLPGCDHFSAIPHAAFRAAVFDFLEGYADDDGFVFE
jgi:pimeloyl-ACP methyl ester carboxylesterase